MTTTTFEQPLLVDPTWLHANLHNDNLVLIDASNEVGATDDNDAPVNKGIGYYEHEHIPGAVHADLLRGLAERKALYRHNILTSEKFEQAIGRLGVSNDSHVVIYDQGPNHWATRLWWNLRLEGFDRISILNGGLPAWKDAGYETASGIERNEPATFTAKRRPELLATKEQVLGYLDDDSVVLINALDEDTFAGRNADYGRPGHIPGSVNLPAPELYDESGKFADAPSAQRYENIGAMDPDKNPVTYCGAGVFAAMTAFDMARNGRTDVAVYDGSLSEWAADDSLPLETGE
ncbi:sulfurtransferase [Corynebacterium guangdongense]|uniref:Thiosulfate/3-mercaptopyruvate sulfurtransferase n=1 Tax=Corynebacterium guangdongense TaxID=1783348 RepID=A0ABU1ZVV0_9CORY|nr:sulfurtransferase [Corynebacterium guangdongense]MDR7329062.1 thiosulfate/3-mercaptopyruvate sulfurtransferase [Corynebacterium guangdongense]WJZ17631.1 3-mercaptopyruvate sulfurtransferase [Corynebacterium guangdongense]